MTNINKFVCDYIDGSVEIKKNLLDGLINISALSRKIADEYGLKKNIDAIISSIRRYEGDVEKKHPLKKLYELLSNARLSTKTKLSSISIKRTDETEKKLVNIHSKILLGRDTTFRFIEHSGYIIIITDKEKIPVLKKVFFEKEIDRIDDKLSEIVIAFKDDLSKISGVYAVLFSELGINDISVVYSMNSHWEQILIVDEKNLEKAFSLILNMTKKKF